MAPQLNISIALIVFMGLVSGGMLALVLMTTRRYQFSFSAVLGLALLLALGGVFSSVSYVENLGEGLLNTVLLLALAFALGYSLTTFSVLSYTGGGKEPPPAPGQSGSTAVICLAPGEPPEYGVSSASRRLALTDDPQDSPPVLLRPFYLRDLRTKYGQLAPSPYREYHLEMAHKLQARLPADHRVYPAFYNDEPHLADTVMRAVSEGANRISIVHYRVSDPPDPVMSGELMEGLVPEKFGVSLSMVGPLWDSDLLPQIYVRRVLEAVPHLDAQPDEIGLLLVGRGHAVGSGRDRSSARRYNQEQTYQRKVRQALLKVGFDPEKVVLGWLRWNSPTVPEAVDALAAAGCKTVLWMPSTFTADGINTLYDIPMLLRGASHRDIKFVPLGGWNADDLAVEEIVGRVRGANAVEAAPARSLIS